MRLLLVILVVVLVGSGLFLRGKEPGAELSQVPTPAAPPVLPVPAERPGKSAMRELLAPARPAIEAAKGKLTPECVAFWNELRGLDLQADAKRPINGECKAVPPALKLWHDRYTEMCFEGPGPACDGALFSYRAQITEELTKDTPLAEITDPKILGDKLLARIDSGFEGVPSPAAIGDVAERLLAVNPDLAAAGDALVMSKFMDARDAAGRSDDKRWDALDAALEKRGRMEGGDSRSLLEARLMAEQMRSTDPNRLAERASEIDRTHPNLGTGPFYQAWAEAKGGNKERAIEYLREAIRREPREGRYYEALEGLQSGNADPFRPDTLHFSINPGR